LSNAAFGPGSSRQPIHFNNVQCSGSEAGLQACTFTLGTSSSCSHDNDASVICTLPPGKGFNLLMWQFWKYPVLIWTVWSLHCSTWGPSESQSRAQQLWMWQGKVHMEEKWKYWSCEDTK